MKNLSESLQNISKAQIWDSKVRACSMPNVKTRKMNAEYCDTVNLIHTQCTEQLKQPAMTLCYDQVNSEHKFSSVFR